MQVAHVDKELTKSKLAAGFAEWE